MNIKKILFATDYSEPSRHALQFATSLARDTGATSLIAHVTDREQNNLGARSEPVWATRHECRRCRPAAQPH